MDWYHKGSNLFSHLGLSQMCNMPTFLMVDRFLSFLEITKPSDSVYPHFFLAGIENLKIIH
ncbi:hypothetical protein Hanom_Chr13g01185851 [Helianthus anomalus]